MKGSHFNALRDTGGISESEFYCDSESGTAAAVDSSKVLVDDLSPCDGQTHAEEECGLGLYRPEVRHLFKRGLEELDLGIPKSMLRATGFV